LWLIYFVNLKQFIMYTFSGKTLRTASSIRTPLLQLVSFFLIALLALSCKKGDTGPAGATGTANVIYSDWFTPATYKKDTIFGSWGFNYDKAATDITQKIVDSGTVIVFGKLSGYNPIIWPTGQVSALPINITYMTGSTPNIDTWSALVTTGNLRIRLVSSLNAYGNISNAHTFRYIIIPGGTKSTASMTPGQVTGRGNVLSNYKQMSYEEVCQQLGVPE
jgi:hypothetical protein